MKLTVDTSVINKGGRSMCSKVLKTVLIALLVSLNVCVWKDVLGDAFYKAGFGASGAILGMYLFAKAFGSWRRP